MTVGLVGGVHFRHNMKGGGGGGLHCLAEEGEVPFMKGQLYDLFNSERFRIDYITTSEVLIPEVQKSGGLKPPPPPPPPPTSISILSLTCSTPFA